MRDYHINIFFSEEDGGYIADIPDLAHCAAFGETPEQALAEVLKAKAAWIEAAKAEGKIDVHLVVAALGRKVERTYIWRGAPERVSKDLEKIQAEEVGTR